MKLNIKKILNICNHLKMSLHFADISIFSIFLMFTLPPLLPDAEIPEDGVEGVVGGDVACDFG